MNNTVPFPEQKRRDDNEQPTAPPAPTGWQRFADRAVDWAGDRIEDILDAPTYGWRGMATWLKALIILTGTALVLWAAWWGITALIGAVRAAEWHSHGTGLIATMHQPVWDYLQTHTAKLPVSATTAYTAWQLFGTASFIASWWLRATGARLTWALWGACTTGMIWAASPATGRTVAAGLAVLTWAAVSTLALRGLTLRPSSFVHVHNDVQTPPVHVRPDIRLPQPIVERVDQRPGAPLRRLTSLTAARPARAWRAGRAEKANPQGKGIVPPAEAMEGRADLRDPDTEPAPGPRLRTPAGLLRLPRLLGDDTHHDPAGSPARPPPPGTTHRRCPHEHPAPARRARHPGRSRPHAGVPLWLRP